MDAAQKCPVAGWLTALGRVFLSLIFVLSGLHKLTALGPTLASMANHGIPFANLLVWGAVALELGADVPFFLDPVPARVRGIGEVIEPLSSMVRLSLVIAVPRVKVPTAKVFAALRPESWSGPLPDSEIPSILSAKISATQVTNDLAKPAMGLFPDIARLKVLLEEEGARVAAMSGSGGAVFGLYPDAPSAEAAAFRLRARAPDALVRSVATTSLAELGNSTFSTEED